MRVLKRAIAPLMAFGLVAAACGDDDSSSDTTAAPVETDAPAATEAPPATEAPAPAETDPPAPAGGLFDGVPLPDGFTETGREDLPEDGEHVWGTAPGEPGDILDAYQGAVEGAGWTIQGGGGDPTGSFGGGFQASAGDGRFLNAQVGGPGGTANVGLCIWPSEPSGDNNCQNDGPNDSDNGDDDDDGDAASDTGDVTAAADDLSKGGEDANFAGVPAPEGFTETDRESINDGGSHVWGTTPGAPLDILGAYQTVLVDLGWTIEGEGGDLVGGSGGGFQASNPDGRYLSAQAGDNSGTADTGICVWPNGEPSGDNNCQNDGPNDN